MCYVYLLISSDSYTYVGATKDLERRLKQHNCLLKGGAKATTSRVKNGCIWSRLCYVENFPDWSSALQFEWKWKYLTRKQGTRLNTIERRMKALYKLINSEKSTNSAVPFVDWEKAPKIIFENDIAEKYYNSLVTEN